jgi:hypothetical protein
MSGIDRKSLRDNRLVLGGVIPDAIDALAIYDEMCADVLSYVYDSGHLQMGWPPSHAVGSSGAQGPNGVWAAGLVRTVLASASKELWKQDLAT